MKNKLSTIAFLLMTTYIPVAVVSVKETEKFRYE